MRILILGLLVFSVISDGNCGFDPPVAGQTRVNFGVDFNYLFSINNMHGSWKHIWTVDMALINRNLDFSVDLKCDSIDPMCDAAKHFVEVMKKATQNTGNWMHQQFEWAHDPSILATLNRFGYQKRRSQRAILPFIGDLEKFLFGTATESDISGIKKTLEDMESLHDKTMSEVSNIGENLASLTKLTNDQISNSKQGFELVKKTFSNMTIQINSRFEKIMKELSKESNIVKYNSLAVGHTWASLESILPQMLEVTKLLIADSQFLEAIQVILQGFLPISLIHPKELSNGLDNALLGIRQQFPSAQLTYDQRALGYYYTHKIITPYFNGESISLVMDVPIDLAQELLHVYAIRTFPVSILPYNPYTRSVDPLSTAGTAQSELITKDTHFLISNDGKSWSSASDIAVSTCVGESVRTCKHQFPMYTFSNSQCLERIWNNKPFSEILDICPYRLSHAGSAKRNNIHVQVIPLARGRWYIESPLNEQWTITCPSRPPEKRSSCTSCVIQVDCGCGIESQYFRIPTRVSSCESVFSPLHKNFSVNPFNYQPTNQPWIVNLTGDDNFQYPPKALPDIHLPDSGAWDDVLENMDAKQYDLNKLYQTQLNETKLFRTEAEALLKKIKTQDKLLASLSGWPDWILGLMVFLTFGNTAVIVLQCCWFFSHARARSLGDTLDIVESETETMLDLEIIEFIMVVFCFMLLIILTWPIIQNWIHNNTIYKKFRGIQVRVKTDSYRRRRGHKNVILQGIFIFSSGSSSISRLIPGQCILASVPIGTHLAHSAVSMKSTVEIQGEKYFLKFQFPVKTITPNEKEITCEGLHFSYDYVHRKCNVPLASKWTAVNDCRIWIE